ncbi:FAD-binding domain-containing protein [Lophiostoma macrostomum CBS 122681]|uniref:FAD-binding domain-containing protein n=1 Tax=Lophiostoma macrostomum CBS 122681 TaxID=1314788 RepID=A0A6A6T3J9_9PLEO|nr:FAD-binding domain-containing protein [Lophiostoma macrostomum CBS 122681]
MRHVLVSAALLLQGALAFPFTPAHPIARAESLRQIVSNLTSYLSPEAEVHYPNDTEWASLLIRGSSPRVYPDYSVVIEVASEADVQLTVQTAYDNGLPFLAISGAHGWTETLNRLPYGIQIRMRKLNTTTVDADGTTATIGGGSLQWETTRALFAENKQAVTGLCECVSIIGPLMGGGHSFLQGQHGFSLDNIVSARVVLANGTLVEASNTENPDLFWALRGAGHNFGIVTSFVVKAYDIASDWTVYSLIYTQDKLEQVLELVNQFENGTLDRPAKLITTGTLVRIPPLSDDPVLAYTVGYEGTLNETAPYAAPFLALEPLSTQLNTSVDFVELYTVTQNNLDAQACTRNNSITGSGVSLPSWKPTAIRTAYNIFANYTLDPRFSAAVILLENYGMDGVYAVDPNSTALAADERKNPIMTTPIIWYVGNDTDTRAAALSWVGKVKDALYIDDESPRHTYVNYAIGSESLQELYGWEEWRVAKLEGLKRAWDPYNAFAYYNPLV